MYMVFVGVLIAYLSCYNQFSSSGNNDEISTKRIIFDDKHLLVVIHL